MQDALAQAEQALKGVSQQPMFTISTLKARFSR